MKIEKRLTSIFIAADGREFDNIDDCQKYEYNHELVDLLMKTSVNFKGSPLHDKQRIIEELDDLNPSDMSKVVELIDELKKNNNNKDLKEDSIFSLAIAPIKSLNELNPGDIFVWQSTRNPKVFDVHAFHSDAGYGIKTFTDYNEKDGSSSIYNQSGFCGKVVGVELILITK